MSKKGEIDYSVFGYKSPIELIYDKVHMEMEGAVMRVVQNMGIEVDEVELLRALRYDREQYERGYKAGYAHREMEIIRCKDCKHRPIDATGHNYGQDMEFPDDVCPCKVGDNWYSWMPADCWFCADGERKETDGVEIHNR